MTVTRRWLDSTCPVKYRYARRDSCVYLAYYLILSLFFSLSSGVFASLVGSFDIDWVHLWKKKQLWTPPSKSPRKQCECRESKRNFLFRLLLGIRLCAVKEGVHRRSTNCPSQLRKRGSCTVNHVLCVPTACSVFVRRPQKSDVLTKST